MNNLATRVVDILKHSEEDPAFHNFIAELADPGYNRYEDVSELALHTFPSHGLVLTSFENRLFLAHFTLERKTFKNVKYNQYTSPLPFDLGKIAKRSDVHALLGVPHKEADTPSPNCQSEQYTLGPWTLVFWYSMPTEKLTEMRVANRSNFKP